MKKLIASALVLLAVSTSAFAVVNTYVWNNNESPITTCERNFPGSTPIDASVAGHWVKCKK